MSVRKRTLPSGEIRWQVDYRDKPGKEGKRRSKQFRTQKEAISYETKVRGEIAAGTHVAASASITVAKAGEEWLERCELEQLEAPPSGNTGSTSICTSCRGSGQRNYPN